MCNLCRIKWAVDSIVFSSSFLSLSLPHTLHSLAPLMLSLPFHPIRMRWQWQWQCGRHCVERESLVVCVFSISLLLLLLFLLRATIFAGWHAIQVLLLLLLLQTCPPFSSLICWRGLTFAFSSSSDYDYDDFFLRATSSLELCCVCRQHTAQHTAVFSCQTDCAHHTLFHSAVLPSFLFG